MASFGTASVLVQRLRSPQWRMLQASPKKPTRCAELRQEKDSPPLVKYTLVVVLIVLASWAAIMYANSTGALGDGWSKISACVGDVLSCNSASSKTQNQ